MLGKIRKCEDGLPFAMVCFLQPPSTQMSASVFTIFMKMPRINELSSSDADPARLQNKVLERTKS